MDRNSIEEQYNNWVHSLSEANDRIALHPSDYPGNTKMAKILGNEEMRTELRQIHRVRGFLSYYAAVLRADNLNNMRLIGISEKEVMDFTNDLGAADDYEEEILNQVDFEKPDIDVDSVTANHAFVRQLDSLLRVKKGTRK